MDTISNVMTHDHKRCDLLFSDTENRVADGAWQEAEHYFQMFSRAMEQHFSHEENTLFPAFENATGNTSGPTMMMRHEHQQMRELLLAMLASLQAKNRERYLGLAETLLIFMQQHNMKEEQILYPMIDNACADQAQALITDFPPGVSSDAA